MPTEGSTPTAFARQYLTVACPCGRSLRAKVELAGSQITCWDCHRSVPVPAPRASIGETFAAFRNGWAESCCADSFGLVLLVAAAITALLCVPRAGVPLATAALVVAAAGYLRLIGRCADGPAEGEADPGSRIRDALAKGSAALLVGLSLGAPFWLSRQGLGGAVRVNGLAWLPLLAAATLFPLVLAALFARDAAGRLGARRLWAAVRRHPIAAALTVAIVPLAAVFTEGLLFVLNVYCDVLGFSLCELFPGRAEACRLFEIPQYAFFFNGISLDERVLRMYAFRLGQGYSLLGAIPPSLSVPIPSYLNTWSIDQPEIQYWLIRTAFTLAAVTIMLMAFSIQARWLAALGALDARRAPANPQALPPGNVILASP